MQFLFVHKPSSLSPSHVIRKINELSTLNKLRTAKVVCVVGDAACNEGLLTIGVPQGSNWSVDSALNILG